MVPMFLTSHTMGLPGATLETRRASGRAGHPTSRIRIYYTNRRTTFRHGGLEVGSRCGLWGAMGPPVGCRLRVWPHSFGGWRAMAGGGGQRGVFPGGAEPPTSAGQGGRGSKSGEAGGHRCYDLRKIRKFWTRE